MGAGILVEDRFDLPEVPRLDIGYRLHPKNPDRAYYDERTDRNIGWITREEQEGLRREVIGIAGCGGMGAQLAEKFLRLGVGELRICDTEVFDISNINRQFAATRKTVGKSKAFETAKMLRDVSDDSTVVVYPQGICRETVEQFTNGCSVICDEIEFWAIAARILLHQYARGANVSVFNCNTVGFGTHLFLFTPKSATMEEMIGFTIEEAEELNRRLREKTARPEEVRLVMERMIAGLVPELPEYVSAQTPEGSNRKAVRKRLMEEGKASIIATNPPFATGFLADRVLLYLLRDSAVRRDIVPTPEAPAYLHIDAAKMEARVVRQGTRL